MASLSTKVKSCRKLLTILCLLIIFRTPTRPIGAIFEGSINKVISEHHTIIFTKIHVFFTNYCINSSPFFSMDALHKLNVATFLCI